MAHCRLQLATCPQIATSRMLDDEAVSTDGTIGRRSPQLLEHAAAFVLQGSGLAISGFTRRDIYFSRRDSAADLLDLGEEVVAIVVLS